jgi:hypothetical protein
MTNVPMIVNKEWKYMEGSNGDQIQESNLVFTWRGWGKLRETSVKMIRTDAAWANLI